MAALGLLGNLPGYGQAADLRLGTNHFHFEAGSEAGLKNLDHQLQGLIARAEGASPAASDYSISLAKKNRRGLMEMQRLDEEALRQPDALRRRQLMGDLLEIAAAINNSQEPPLPEQMDVFEMPVHLWQLFRPVGRGKTPASNLAPGPAEDLSQRDPLPSPFWRRPANISAEDLFNGFGRRAFPVTKGGMCSYEAPKESYGMNPGFEVNCGGETVKLKFGEVSSEPAVTRFFWALGFNADPTDYSPGVKLHYNRRIFQEFNSRHELQIRLTLLGVIPFYTMKLQRWFDPFDFIAEAVLRDGRRWTGRQLEARLLRHPLRSRQSPAGADFRPELEAQIDYLLTVPANVQAKSPSVKSIGHWDYGQLDHASRREVRGAGLLAAWVGFFDARPDNTRVRLVGPKKNPKAVNYFSDLGGGLGRTSGLFSWHGENPRAFPWTFTRPAPGTNQFRIAGYRPIVPNAAFAAMTVDDARWMARLIAQLTKSQIIAALTASGYNPADTRLYTKKLLSRRARMLRDLGLSGEPPN